MNYIYIRTEYESCHYKNARMKKDIDRCASDVD